MIVLDSSHVGFNFNLNAFLSTRNEDSKARLKNDPLFSSAVDTVRLLNLHQTYPVLCQLYSLDGHKARKQFEILRSTILMLHFRCFSLTEWHQRLNADSQPAGICGFLDGDISSLGLFYNFVSRLVNIPKTSSIQPVDFNISKSLAEAKEDKKKTNRKGK